MEWCGIEKDGYRELLWLSIWWIEGFFPRFLFWRVFWQIHDTITIRNSFHLVNNGTDVKRLIVECIYNFVADLSLENIPKILIHN